MITSNSPLYFPISVFVVVLASAEILKLFIFLDSIFKSLIFILLNGIVVLGVILALALSQSL